MSEWTFWDWLWWITAFVALPLVFFVHSQWQSHRTYREIRKHTDQIGRRLGK